MSDCEVNHALPDETMRQFHERIIGQYPAEKIEPAVTYLREKVIKLSDFAKIREAIDADPDNWVAPYHFFFGMAVRNALRDGGFGEDYFPIWNLDDIYVPLIERAVKDND